MKLSQENLDTLAICSLRYALGRQTYAVDEVASLVERMWDDLSPNGKIVIQRDLQEALRQGRVGADMDRERWEKLLAFIQK